MESIKDKIVEDTKEFEEKINLQSSDSIKAKLLCLYKNQRIRDDMLGKGFNEEFYALEYKYNVQYIEILKQIREIINSGSPIPMYWRTAIVNSKFFTVNNKDKEVLAYLKHINVVLNEEDKKSFTLIFEFDQNQFFDHKNLEKTYIFNRKEDRYEGSGITEIQWKVDAPNKKKVVKKVKRGKTNSKITTEKRIESFFNIFEKYEKLNDEDNDEEDEDEFENDVTSEADFFMEDLIPYSLEHYLNFQKLSHEHHDGCCDDDHDNHHDTQNQKKK